MPHDDGERLLFIELLICSHIDIGWQGLTESPKVSSAPNSTHAG
jgi:hypothetical protein